MFEGTWTSGDITRPGRAGVVVAAPRARADQGTGAMATEIARLTGFGLVVATGSDMDEAAAYERRVRDAARGPLAFYVEIQGDGQIGRAHV